MSEPTSVCPRCQQSVLPAMARCRNCGQALARASASAPVVSSAELTSVAFRTSVAAQQSTESRKSSGSTRLVAQAVVARTATNVSSESSVVLESDTKTAMVDRGTPMPESSERMKIACSCGATLRVSKTLQGKRVKCPKCAASVPVTVVATVSTLKPNDSADKPNETSRVSGVEKRPTPAATRSGVTSAPKLSVSTNSSDEDDELLLEMEIAAASKLPMPKDSECAPRKKLSSSKLKKLLKQLEVVNVLSDAETVSRRQALLELGQSQDSQVLEVLIEHVADTSSIIRDGAITALGELGDPEAVSTVLQGLLDPNDDVIRAALTAIKKIGDRRVVRPLLRFGIERPRWKPFANDALVKLGPQLLGELLLVLQTNDPGLTLDAIVVLGRIGDRQAVPSLIACLDHVSNLLRAHVTEALALIGDPLAVPQMLRALEDTNVAVRVNAAAGLVRMTDPRSLCPLLKALQDEDSDVRRYAAVGIGELQDPKAVPELIHVLSAWEQLAELDAEFLEAVVEAVGKLQDTQAVPALLPLLQAKHDGVLLKTVLALKQLRDASAIPELLKLLRSPKPTLRRRVVETLGKSGDLSVVPILGELLQADFSHEVRAAVARAFGELKSKQSIPFLEAALRDEVAVRCQAVIAIGNVGEKKALPALMAMLKDSAPEVRYHAVSAIAKLNEPKTLKMLAIMLEDSDQMVQTAAKNAIEQFGEVANVKEVNEVLKRVKSRALFTKFVPAWLFLLIPHSVRARRTVAAVLASSLLLAFVIKSSIGGPTRIAVRGNVQSIALNADGSLLVAERTMGMLEVWDVNSQSVKNQTDLAGTRLPMFAGKDQIVLLSKELVVPWPLRGTPNVSNGWKEHKQAIEKSAVTPDGKFAVTMAKDFVAITWNLESGGKHVEAELSEQFPDALTINHSGQWLASSNRNGSVRVIAADGGKEIRQLLGNMKPIAAMAFSPDNQLLVGVEPGGLRVWDLSESAEAAANSMLIESKTPLSLIGLRVLSDSKRVLTASTGGEVQMWDLEKKESRVVCSGEIDQADGFALSADEKRVAIGGSMNSAVLVFDIESGELFKTLDVRGR